VQARLGKILYIFILFLAFESAHVISKKQINLFGNSHQTSLAANRWSYIVSNVVDHSLKKFIWHALYKVCNWTIEKYMGNNFNTIAQASIHISFPFFSHICCLVWILSKLLSKAGSFVICHYINWCICT
jgi:hypothetical protein